MRFLSLFITLLLPVFAQAQEMTFGTHSNGGNCANCGWSSAQGVITKDTPDQFAAFLAEGRHSGQIVFDSPGGDLGAALKLGRMIRAAGLSTGIAKTTPMDGTPWFEISDGTCESACAFAFMGGTARFVEEGNLNPRSGRLGMHQFYTRTGSEIPSAATQQIMGQLLIYMIEMGVNPEALSLASNATAEDMYFFSLQEATRLGLHTSASVSDMDFVMKDGGLALTWSDQSASGSIWKTAWLYCDLDISAWVLEVRDYGAAGGSLGFDPQNPKDLMFETGGTRREGVIIPLEGEQHPMDGRHILDLREDGADRVIRVHLPVDLRDYPGEEFFFRTNLLRNFMIVLSADARLPDSETLDLLARACVRS